MEPLSEDTIERVRELVNSAHCLFENLPIQYHVILKGDELMERLNGIIGSYGKVKSPHYIVACTEVKPGFRLAAGYSVAHIALSLNNLGIATCMTAGGLTTEDFKEVAALGENDVPVLILGFGNPEVPEDLYGNPKYYKRKPMGDLVLSGLIKRKYKDIFDAARLAPSSMNTQPWRFIIEEKKIHVMRTKLGFIKNALFKSLNKIDMGIVLAHMVIAMKAKGIKFSLKKEPFEFQGVEYTVTIELKS